MATVAVFPYAPYDSAPEAECEIEVDVILTISKTIKVKAKADFVDEDSDCTTAYFTEDCVDIPQSAYKEIEDLGWRVDDTDFELLDREVVIASRIEE